MYYWKKSMYKWTRAFQNHVVQGSTVYVYLFYVCVCARTCIYWASLWNKKFCRNGVGGESQWFSPAYLLHWWKTPGSEKWFHLTLLNLFPHLRHSTLQLLLLLLLLLLLQYTHTHYHLVLKLFPPHRLFFNLLHPFNLLWPHLKSQLNW